MILKNFNTNPEPEEDVFAGVAAVLRESGIGKTEDKTEKLEETRNLFKSKGASLEVAAQTIANVMARGETDAVRLKASEMAMKVHGILDEINEKSVPQITINVTGTENKTLINLVLPV